MSISVNVPANSQIRIVGLANSGSWSQRITITGTGGNPLQWVSEGAASNKEIGSATLPPASAPRTLQITMEYSTGSGWQASSMVESPFDQPGLSGFVVGGQDGGGRPAGPAYWNTVAFIYFCKGY